ncbi:MAG TPA: phage minor head protein [Terriglobales bacterium]|nr:phage minor head protein [Terriglobales bacterium]
MAKKITVSPAATYPKKRKAERAMARTLKKMFKGTKKDALPDMVEAYRRVMEEHRVSKAIGGERDHILDELDLDSWIAEIDALSGSVSDVQVEAAKRALTALKVSDDDDLFDKVSELAVQAAKDRAAELVGMKWDGDKLVPNPSAEWAITEATREGIRDMVETALTDGLTVDEFAKKLMDSYMFSDSRAETIARTEIARAHVDGTMEAWKASGLVTGKRWLTGSEHDDGSDCDCADNEDDGVIDLDDAFSSGDDAPPAHPNCVCVLVTSLLDSAEE